MNCMHVHAYEDVSIVWLYTHMKYVAMYTHKIHGA